MIFPFGKEVLVTELSRSPALYRQQMACRLSFSSYAFLALSVWVLVFLSQACVAGTRAAEAHLPQSLRRQYLRPGFARALSR